MSYYIEVGSTRGSLVKGLRRRPLTAETGVRFPYELLFTSFIFDTSSHSLDTGKSCEEFFCPKNAVAKKIEKNKKSTCIFGKDRLLYRSRFDMRFVGQGVKTPPSHGGNRGSIPLRTVKWQETAGEVGFLLFCYAGNTDWYCIFSADVVIIAVRHTEY